MTLLRLSRYGLAGRVSGGHPDRREEPLADGQCSSKRLPAVLDGYRHFLESVCPMIDKVVYPDESKAGNLAELVEIPLYKKVEYEFRGVAHKGYLRSALADLEFDAFCIHCGKESYFKRDTSNDPPSGGGARGAKLTHPINAVSEDIITFKFCCARSSKHVYSYIFKLDSESIEKVGQSPSLAKILKPTLERFKGVLTTRIYNDLQLANELWSHGIGAGSLVYLRRVLENLIVDASSEMKNCGEDPPEGFEKLRIPEKINAVKSHLPCDVWKVRSSYSVLSKGIHSLSERKCREIYPTMLGSIQHILNMKIDERNKKKTEDDTSRALQKVEQDVKKL